MGNKRDHTSVMDLLTSLYSDFVMDDREVCSWPHAARGELFAVARRDIAVARRNLARLTHYVDLQDDHLAACDGALDDGLPLMNVEMCSRPTGGVRSVLDVAGRPK